MVGCKIRGEFVQVGLRNRSGTAQQFLPHRARFLVLRWWRPARLHFEDLGRTEDRVLMMVGIIEGNGCVV